MPRSSRAAGGRGHLDLVYALSRRIAQDEDAHGILTLRDPQDHRIQQVLRKLRVRIPAERRLTLDEYGSFVVRQFDGTVSVAEIGRRLTEQFGADAEPVFERLVPYLRTLERQGMIVTDAPRA